VTLKKVINKDKSLMELLLSTSTQDVIANLSQSGIDTMNEVMSGIILFWIMDGDRILSFVGHYALPDF